jgi:phage protein D
MTERSGLSDFDIRIKGKSLTALAKDDVKAIRVEEDLAAAGMFAIELYNSQTDGTSFTWSDDSLFAPGSEVEIWLGEIKALQKVLLGEITSLEPAFYAESVPTLTVRGYDHRHRLLRGSKTRSFKQTTDSAIAEQIASEAGLAAQVDRTRVTLEYVLQHNQTDLAFLQDRAQRIGYEVYVHDKQLHFRRPKNSAKEVMTLSLGQNLIEFFPRLSTMNQVGELLIRGWDVKNKAALVGRAKVGNETTTMGGTTSGARAAERAFGRASAAGVSRPLFNQAEADQMALGQFNARALAYISGEGLCEGAPGLHAGVVVKVEGAGSTFSGRYYVTAVTHTVAPGRGYLTRFRVQRIAA